MNRLLQVAAVLVTLLMAAPVWALNGVHPTGVNVSSTGPTSVFITFQGTAGQTSSEAFWCGEITVPANTVTTFNPCVGGTLFGFLPTRNDLSRASGTGGASNLTDIMTIPSSVTRRAFQDARSGAKSSFFYVRKFTGGGKPDQFVAVTCRMAGGGARVPLALMDVKLMFRTKQGDRAVTLLDRGETSPPMGARIFYNGSGRLKGRWEIMMPGDPEPTVEDLLPEASLPIEKRALQRRYTLLERFDVYLNPVGSYFVPGPDPSRIPTQADGSYKILFRVEASAEKEGDSDTTAGIVQSGGVAGFAMPVLRYVIGVPSAKTASRRGASRAGSLRLTLPVQDGVFLPGEQPEFSWVDVSDAVLYRLEIINDQGEVLTAMVKPGVSRYQTPPWFQQLAGQPMRWRVVALDVDGKASATSGWRRVKLNQ